MENLYEKSILKILWIIYIKYIACGVKSRWNCKTSTDLMSKIVEYLNPIFFRAPLIFAQQRRAKINGERKRPIFAQLGARKLIVRVLLKF